MIICPKCGKVELYSIKEHAHRKKLYYEDGEFYKATEYVISRRSHNPPRCYKCGSIVRFYINPFEDTKEVEKWTH